MSTTETANPQKSRRGLVRIWHAARISVDGFRAGWQEPSFRQEIYCAIVMVPSAFWVGQRWMEIALLLAVLALVLITELLNTAIEVAIDRVGAEWHPLSKTAKDVGSAAVLVSILLCAGVWITAVWQRLAG